MTATQHMYEFTYIITPVLSEEQIKDTIKRVNKVIENGGGTIIEVDEWGSRRLAYQINKKRNGYYVNMYFEASGEFIARLERSIEIDDNILRYLTLRMDKKMTQHYEMRQKQAAVAAPASAAEGKAIASKATEGKATEGKAAEVKATEVKAAEVKATEVKAAEVKATEVKATEVKAAEVKAAE